MDAGFFKGTSADQDNRFVDKNKKLMKTMKFGDALEKKVDMTRVDMEIIRPWINSQITEYIGYEDDVLFEFVCNQLESQSPDGRQMQMNLTGFLNAKNAREFMQKLWELLLSAMDDICGIPTELMEQKKEQIRVKQAEQERIKETLKTQQNMIQEALAKIKVNAAGNNNGSPSPVTGGRGRASSGISGPKGHGHADANVSSDNTRISSAAAIKTTKGEDDDAASINHSLTDDTKLSMKTMSRGDNKKRHGSYGRNRMRSPLPPSTKAHRRSRDGSPYSKLDSKRSRSRDSDRRRSRSRESGRRLHRSKSPHQRKKSSPRHERTHLSQHLHSPQRSQQHTSRARPEDIDNATSFNRSGSPRRARKRSESRLPAAENSRMGKTPHEPSVFHHRNYRSHHRLSSPDSASSQGIDYTRDSGNIRKKSLTPPQRVMSNNDHSPQRKHSVRYSSSAAHHREPQSGKIEPPEDGHYVHQQQDDYPSRRHSSGDSRVRTRQRSFSASPRKRLPNEPRPRWKDDRRQSSPGFRYDYGEFPNRIEQVSPDRRYWADERQVENPSHLDRRTSPGFYDGWRSNSKWEGEDRRQSPVPRHIPGYKRQHLPSSNAEKQRMSPYVDRYAGREARWPTQERELRNSDSRRYNKTGAMAFEQARDSHMVLDRRDVEDFMKRLSPHHQRYRSRSPPPFERDALHDSRMRILDAEQLALESSSAWRTRREVSPMHDRRSHVYARTTVVHHLENYPVGRDREYREPSVERLDEYNKGDLRLRDRYDNSRGVRRRDEYDSYRREDRLMEPHVLQEDSRKYLNRRSRSHSRPRSGSPRWTHVSKDYDAYAGKSSGGFVGEELMESRYGRRKDEVLGESQRVLALPLPRKGRPLETDRHQRDKYEYGRMDPRGEDLELDKKGRTRLAKHSFGSPVPDRQRSASSSRYRRETHAERYHYAEDEMDNFDHTTKDDNGRIISRSASPASPLSKRMKLEDLSDKEGSEAELETRKKKKKKDKKKKKKKHKKHRKHKHKKSQDDDNSDETTGDIDDIAAKASDSQSKVTEEAELRKKALVSMKKPRSTDEEDEDEEDYR